MQKHQIEGALPSLQNLFSLVRKEKKKKFKTTSVFCNSCTAWKSKAALFLQFYFFFPFRENNHLEASLHSAPKETIFKKNEADAPCCFS